MVLNVNKNLNAYYKEMCVCGGGGGGGGGGDEAILFLWLKCCFTSTKTIDLLGMGTQDIYLDFHTAPELWSVSFILVATVCSLYFFKFLCYVI